MTSVDISTIQFTKCWADAESDEELDLLPLSKSSYKQEKSLDIVAENEWTTVTNKKKVSKKKQENCGIMKSCIRINCKNQFLFSEEEAQEFEKRGWKPRSVCKECKNKEKIR